MGERVGRKPPAAGEDPPADPLMLELLRALAWVPPVRTLPDGRRAEVHVRTFGKAQLMVARPGHVEGFDDGW